MKTILLLMAALLVAAPTFAANGESAKTNLSPDQAEANYTRAIEGRTAKIMHALALTDTNQAARVHDIIMAQWRALNAWHNENDAKLKAAKSDPNAVAQIQASLRRLHNEYVAKLAEYLTPAQIETVKDGMTYGVVEATYRAYLEIVPNLTASDKAKILELLKEGREEAMDAGSSKEKAAIMKRYKGKINNYLNAHGHDVGKAYKDWGAKQKAKTAARSAPQQ
jgi:Protein of unknown function (DUF3826)